MSYESCCFLSPVIFHIHLACKCSLYLMEVILILRVWVEIQWIPCYFYEVCEKMMSWNELNVQGILIGHYVLEITYCLYYYINKDPNLSHLGKRSFDYRNVTAPDKNAWCESVEKIVYVSLQSFRNNIKPSTKNNLWSIIRKHMNT